MNVAVSLFPSFPNAFSSFLHSVAHDLLSREKSANTRDVPTSFFTPRPPRERVESRRNLSNDLYHLHAPPPAPASLSLGSVLSLLRFADVSSPELILKRKARECAHTAFRFLFLRVASSRAPRTGAAALACGGAARFSGCVHTF